MMQQTNNAVYPTYGALALSGAYHEAEIVQFPVRRATRNSAPSRQARRNAADLRIVLFGALVLATLAVVSITSVAIARANYANIVSNMQTREISVSSGDTLWSIAQSHPVDGLSDADVVSWLESENNLSSVQLTVGQTLVVPV